MFEAVIIVLFVITIYLIIESDNRRAEGQRVINDKIDKLLKKAEDG